jgi:hypothetical protein
VVAQPPLVPGAVARSNSRAVLASTTQGGGSSGGWADSTNTGYRNAPGYPGSLTSGTGFSPFANGQTYNFSDFGPTVFGSSSSSLLVGATFNGCRFKGVSVNDALTVSHTQDCTFNYCSFEPGVSAPPTPFASSYQYGFVAGGPYNSQATGLRLSHCDIWGFGNAIEGCGGSASHPSLIEWCWIHDAADDGGQYHTDGIGMTDTGTSISYLTVDHCRIQSHGNTNGLAWQQGTYDHVSVTNTIFSGFGYTVALWATSTNVVFTDNTYETKFQPNYGPLYPQAFWVSNPGSWRRNRWKHDPAGEWGNPAHDGRFWVPNTPDMSTEGYDSGLVTSASDFTG